MKLNFTVENQILLSAPENENVKVVADSKKYLIAHFDFKTEEWKDTIVYALFTAGKNTYKMILGADADLGDNECYVPYEVIKAPGFTVSCYSADRVPTTVVQVPVLKSGYTEKIANQNTTPSVMEQMNSYMLKYASLCNEIYKECVKIREEIGGKN